MCSFFLVFDESKHMDYGNNLEINFENSVECGCISIFNDNNEEDEIIIIMILKINEICIHLIDQTFCKITNFISSNVNWYKYENHIRRCYELRVDFI